MTYEQYEKLLAGANTENKLRSVIAVGVKADLPWAWIMPAITSCMQLYGSETDQEIAQLFDQAVYALVPQEPVDAPN